MPADAFTTIGIGKVLPALVTVFLIFALAKVRVPEADPEMVIPLTRVRMPISCVGLPYIVLAVLPKLSVGLLAAPVISIALSLVRSIVIVLDAASILAESIFAVS